VVLLIRPSAVLAEMKLIQNGKEKTMKFCNLLVTACNADRWRQYMSWTCIFPFFLLDRYQILQAIEDDS
jgi:hypothetical protein